MSRNRSSDSSQPKSFAILRKALATSSGPGLTMPAIFGIPRRLCEFIACHHEQRPSRCLDSVERKMLRVCLLAFAFTLPITANAEAPQEWIALGTRVHGGFGSFIPLGIKIGLDAVQRLNAKPRTLGVLYYDSDSSPCACFADGVAIATYASVGQRTLTISPEKAPASDAAVIVIRPRQGGPGFKYTIPVSALAKLGEMNKSLDERGRYDAVMSTDGLFQVEPAP